MKKLIKNIVPKGLFSQLKLRYYNFKTSDYTFGLKGNNFSTSVKNNWKVITNKPLYFIVRDIDRYEKYYKIKQDDVVIDAGANEGSLSVVYSKKVGQNGTVYAFEPDSMNIATLNDNMSLNQDINNISIVEKALWDKTETIEFFEAGSVGSSIFYKDENAKKVTMQATSIDDFVSNNKLDQLNFIKMDIEGAEIEALTGSVETIKQFRPLFAIASYHIVNGEATYHKLEEFFKQIDYPFKTEFFMDGEIITYAGIEILH